MGYKNPEHTNWHVWKVFDRIYRELDYPTEWLELNELAQAKKTKRLYVCWNEPDTETLYNSGLCSPEDIFIQKLTSLGKHNSDVNWGGDPLTFFKNWTWPLYKMVENLLDRGVNIYAFGCKTVTEPFPEKHRICEKIKSRLHWIPWGSCLYNWQEIQEAKPLMNDFIHDVGFVGSRWGVAGRGNVERLEQLLDPILAGRSYLLAGRGFTTGAVDDETHRQILKTSKLCPVINAASWVAEKGVQDRFWSVFTSGRFGVADSEGVYDFYTPDEVVCETDPGEYVSKSKYFIDNLEAQRPYIEKALERIKTEYNYYTTWKNIFTSIEKENHKTFQSAQIEPEQEVSSKNISFKTTNETPSGKWLFAPSMENHYHWMKPLAKITDNPIYTFFPNKKEHADEFMIKDGVSPYAYRLGILSELKPSLVILGNDWGTEERALAEEAKATGIASVCIQEGCLDLDDGKANRLRNAEYILLQGVVNTRYLAKHNNVYITGNPRFDDLHPVPLPEKPLALINVNFTYGIFEEAREAWVRDAINECRSLGLEFFLSIHPRDKSEYPPDIPIIKSNAYTMKEQLSKASLVISRFSTIIFEAAALGRPTIYYNPHKEPFPIFEDDNTGAILKAKNPQELNTGLKKLIENPGIPEYTRDCFLLNHINTINHDATQKCLEALKDIEKNHEQIKAKQKIIKKKIRDPKKTAYVIGNGPSLNKIDLSLLRGKTTMSFNRAYIAYEDWGFYPTYYMIIDVRVLSNTANDVNRLIETAPIQRFFIRDQSGDPAAPAWNTRASIIAKPNVTFFKTTDNPKVFPPKEKLVYWGDVSVCSLQVLYDLGYTDVMLLGCDCRYQADNIEGVSMEGGKYISQKDADPNHFRPDYFGTGTEYSNPHGEGHFNSWKTIAPFIKEIPNFNVYSGSPGSRLNDEVWEYVDFKDFVEGKK